MCENVLQHRCESSKRNWPIKPPVINCPIVEGCPYYGVRSGKYIRCVLNYKKNLGWSDFVWFIYSRSVLSSAMFYITSSDLLSTLTLFPTHITITAEFIHLITVSFSRLGHIFSASTMNLLSNLLLGSLSLLFRRAHIFHFYLQTIVTFV
jgi:hypothetical protein